MCWKDNNEDIQRNHDPYILYILSLRITNTNNSAQIIFAAKLLCLPFNFCIVMSQNWVHRILHAMTCFCESRYIIIKTWVDEKKTYPLQIKQKLCGQCPGTIIIIFLCGKLCMHLLTNFPWWTGRFCCCQ